MYILYNILIHLVFLFLLPYFILTMAFEGRYRSGLAERFGFIHGQKLKRLSGSRVVWFHAVSVGETKAVIPLVRLFKKRHPEVKVGCIFHRNTHGQQCRGKRRRTFYRRPHIHAA
jgi:3-deoxy-D-manno-octulosonic-acid transferase